MQCAVKPENKFTIKSYEVIYQTHDLSRWIKFGLQNIKSNFQKKLSILKLNLNLQNASKAAIRDSHIS